MLKIVLILFMILAALALFESYRETHSFRVTRYTVSAPKLEGLKRELRLVVLADLHNREYGEGNEELLKAIEEERPDLVLIAGDMVVAKPGHDLKAAEHVLRALSRKWPVYYALGNHEYRLKIYPEDYGPLYEEFLKVVADCGIVLLDNESESVHIHGARLAIHGLSIDREYYGRFAHKAFPKGYVGELLGTPAGDEFHILLAHNPTYFEQYADWGADLTFSGHLHGGVVNLPGIGGVVSPQVKLFPRYSGGRYERDGHVMLLSRGLGTHTINVRLFNPAELLSVRLKNENG